MQSNAVLATAIAAAVGFLINGMVMFLVLSRGRKKYHYLFSALLFCCAMWDLGIFLIMIRNSFPDEIFIYGYVVVMPCLFIPALIYHFTGSYINQLRKKSTILIWAYCTIVLILYILGIGGGATGIYHYSWGSVFQAGSIGQPMELIWHIFMYTVIWSSCWFLFRAHQRETSTIARRHTFYILISFLAISFALVKIIVTWGVDNRYLLPAGMLLTSIFGAVIGTAIIKYRLLDITVIIKKTTIYSILVALIIFVFSLSEHMLATYVGEIFGEHSIFIHIISIAVVIAVLMPVRHKLERAIERFFAKKKVEF